MTASHDWSFRICAIKMCYEFCISPNESSMDVIDVVYYTNIYTSKVVQY